MRINTNEVSNKELLDRNEKFIALLENHAGIVHKLCFMYTNNAEEYKDLKQEISYQLIKSYKKYKGKSKLSTWVYKVALFTALTFIRQKPASHSQLDTVADYKVMPGDNEWGDVLMQIKRLPDIEKSLIFLYLEDKPYKEIAEIMGITESNVGVRLNRIKLKLKNYFKED